MFECELHIFAHKCVHMISQKLSHTHITVHLDVYRNGSGGVFGFMILCSHGKGLENSTYFMIMPALCRFLWNVCQPPAKWPHAES